MYILSYMIVDDLMWSYIIPCTPCGGTPYFFSGGNPQVTAHGHFLTLRLGVTSAHI